VYWQQSQILFLLFFAFILIIISYKFFPGYVFGDSPSFSRQVINNLQHTWETQPMLNGMNCTDIQNRILYPQMEAVSYFSDGKVLNATIWLSDRFDEHPLHAYRLPIYAMAITIISPNKIDTGDPDYAVMISWNQTNQEWDKKFVEYSKSNDSIVSSIYNISSDFFHNEPILYGVGGKGHINFSLDLKKITSPEQYMVLFGMQDNFLNIGKGYNYSLCMVRDFGNNIAYVPPPKFSISTAPSNLILRPGDQKNLELRVNSSILGAPLISFSTNQSKAIGLNFRPTEEHLTPEGITASNLNLNVFGNATAKPYTLPIYATITFPSLNIQKIFAPFTNLIFSSNNQSKQIESMLLRPTYFTVTVIEPLTWQENFSNIWSVWGGFINLIGGGFAAGFAALVLDRFKIARKNQTKKSK
jgi:hypothetical protein